MHSYTTNFSLQIIPVTDTKHPYAWIDEAIALIQQSGVKYEVGPFATVIEGTYEELFSLVHQINEFLFEKNCEEWIMNLQVQLRSGRSITAQEKIEKFQHNSHPAKQNT